MLPYVKCSRSLKNIKLDCIIFLIAEQKKKRQEKRKQESTKFKELVSSTAAES